MKCFVNVATEGPPPTATPFDVLSVFDTRTCVDFTFLVNVYKKTVAEGFTPAERHAVLAHFLEAFKNKSAPPSELTHALRLIVIPTLEATLADAARDSFGGGETTADGGHRGVRRERPA